MRKVLSTSLERSIIKTAKRDIFAFDTNETMNDLIKLLAQFNYRVFPTNAIPKFGKLAFIKNKPNLNWKNLLI